MHRPASEDSASTRSSSAASSKGVSEGNSSASGVSDTTDAPRPQQKQSYQPAPVSRGSAAPTGGVSLALEAATAQCSMCDDAASSLLCTQCGRLSFCTSCCISLHDNKFLSGHKLLSLEPMREGQVVLLADLKEAAKEKKRVAQQMQVPPHHHHGDHQEPATHAAAASPKQRGAQPDQPPVLTSPFKPSTPPPQQSKHNDSTSANRPDAISVPAAEMPDAAALAADRNIIQARLAELQSCRTLLHQASEGLSRERFQCKDISQTAAESIRKRFDVLRRVISEKEGEYIATVETAAKKRLEDATKASFEATAALAECDAFLEQTDLQLDRLAANKKMFAEARPSLLASTEAKLRSVDDAIQKLQGDLDRITTTSLGVHIVLDRAIEEVQRLIVPQLILPAHLVDASHVKPIPSDAFTASPGVKVIRQSSVERAPTVLRLGGGNGGGTAGSSTSVHRQSFQQELDALRGTPLRDLRQQQQQQQQQQATIASAVAASPQPKPQVGPMPISLAGRRSSVASAAASPAPATGSSAADHVRGLAATAEHVSSPLAPHNASVPASAVIAKISQKFAASGATLARVLLKPSAPKELEKLREVVAASVATTNAASPWQQQRKGSSAGGGSSASVGSRCRSPIAAASSQRMFVDSPRATAPGISRTDSPMRQTQLAPYRYSISPARSNPDATPGPGAYYKPTDFAARSLLSTPPRRR